MMRRVRWRLVVGLISALVAVGVTLPVAAARVDLGARIAIIWPNPATIGDDLTTSLPPAEVIWPNGARIGNALGQ